MPTSLESSANDILDVAGAYEERSKLRREVYEDQLFQEKLSKNISEWKKQITEKYPILGTAEYQASLEEAIKGISFIDWFSRNKLKTADAPLLQPRDPKSDNSLLSVGTEDLIDKFTSGDIHGALEQVVSGQSIIDGSAFSSSHNIHLGLVPLYIIREEALGLVGHLKHLQRATTKTANS